MHNTLTLTLKSLSRVRLCHPMDCNLPGSSVHGIFQAIVLEWGGCYFLLQEIFPIQGSNPSLPPCRQTLYRLSHQGSLVDYRYSVVQQMPRAYSSCLTETVSEWVSEIAKYCPTLSDPRNCSLPGSSVHGIFQARVLEWDAIAFSNWGLFIINSYKRGNSYWTPSLSQAWLKYMFYLI